MSQQLNEQSNSSLNNGVINVVIWAAGCGERIVGGEY